MVKKNKLLKKVSSGSRNIRFDEFVSLLEGLGFTLKRVKGSHHIFGHPKIPKAFPIQPKENGQAKPYQIHQLLKLIEVYNLRLESEEDELDEGEK